MPEYEPDAYRGLLAAQGADRSGRSRAQSHLTFVVKPVDETDGVRTVRSPLRLGATPAAVSRRAPRLGEHSDEIRRWLGG